MPFGAASQATLKSKPTTTSNTTEGKTDNPFLRITEGYRLVRFPNIHLQNGMSAGDEIALKEYWLAKDPETGKWVPKFGYVKGDSRKSIPVYVGVSSPTGWNQNYKNPLELYLDTIAETPEHRKTMYPKQLFWINVLDETMVKIGADGKIHYPLAGGRYEVAGDSFPLNKIRILTGSYGRIFAQGQDGGEIVGKHFYAQMLRAYQQEVIDLDDGSTTNLFEQGDFSRQLRITRTGKAIETSYSFTLTSKRAETDWSQYEYYDFSTIRPWPDAALADLLDGADYQETVKKYNITLYPPLVRPVV